MKQTTKKFVLFSDPRADSMYAMGTQVHKEKKNMTGRVEIWEMECWAIKVKHIPSGDLALLNLM